MQLVCQAGIVVAHYDDGASVPMAAFPGAVLQSYEGALDDLARVGDPPAAVPGMRTPDDRPFAAPAIDLAAYAAAIRYAKETAGITVGNAPIATDRDSQGMITGAWAAAQINPSISVAWKTTSGWVTINAAQIQAIATAVLAHVQACFTVEQQVDQAIKAGTITSAAQVDAAFAAVAA